MNSIFLLDIKDLFVGFDANNFKQLPTRLNGIAHHDLTKNSYETGSFMGVRILCVG